MNERAMTAKDVAREYGVHLYTVYHWIKRGELVGVRLPGGGHRFRRDHLDAFEAQRRDRKKSLIDETDTVRQKCPRP